MGNLPLLKRLSKRDGGQYIALYNLAKEYNTNVLGLKLGSNYVVTVFSYPVVKSVLTSEEYDGRPNSFFIRLRCMGIIRGKIARTPYFSPLHNISRDNRYNVY